MAEYIAEFSEYLLDEKKFSKNTLDSYLRDVRGFLAFIETLSLSVIAVDRPTIEQYLEGLTQQGRSKSTVTRTLGGIRCFYQYLVQQGKAATDPTDGIRLGHVDKQLPELLTQREIDALLAQPDISTLKGCRDKAMLELLYATGMRVSELVDTDLDNLNLQINIVHCIHGGNDRIIPVYNEAIRAIEDYLSRVRPLISNDKSGRSLFLNMNGSRLTRQGFWKILKGYVSSAGIEKVITPHTMRHSLAAQMLENGADIRELKEFLGHSGLSSTQIYTQIIKQRYDNSYKKHHPRAGL